MDTNAIYTKTSGVSHSAFTAKSPRINAPSMEKELDSAAGVFRDASFRRSIKNSTVKSCASSGSAQGSGSARNSSHSGRRPGTLTSRYHIGVTNMLNSSTPTRTKRRYVPTRGGK